MILPILIFLLFLIPILILNYRIFFEVRIQNQLNLWYQCCKALNIEREEIAKVVGKWAMPAFEKKSEQD